MPYCLQDDFLSLKIQWESQEHYPTSSSKGAASQINASIMSFIMACLAESLGVKNCRVVPLPLLHWILPLCGPTVQILADWAFWASNK